MKKTAQKKTLFFCAALALFLGACNDATTTGSSNSGSSLTTSFGSVTLSALNGDTLMVHMPKEVFGANETEMAFSTVETWVGTSKIASLSGENLNYAPGTSSAWFTVSSLQDGDNVSFVVRSASGSEQIFTAAVSDAAGVTASLSGEAPVAEETDGPTATFGQLANGRSLIIIPLEAFGSSTDDLDGATIDISLNSEVVSEDLDASAYYSATYDAVRFYLSGLEDGDALRFKLYLTDGSTATFYGEVSATGDAEIPQS